MQSWERIRGLSMLFFLERACQYEKPFQAVLDACEVRGYTPDSRAIIGDHEMAATRVAKEVLGQDISTVECFFHLCQLAHTVR